MNIHDRILKIDMNGMFWWGPGRGCVVYYCVASFKFNLIVDNVNCLLFKFLCLPDFIGFVW